MKKFLLLLFLGFVLLLGFYIITTQNKLNSRVQTTTTTTLAPTTKLEITNKTISEDTDNYMININYPQTQISEIDSNTFNDIEKQIKDFKDAVKIPSPNGAKTTLIINYAIIYNNEDLLSIKFETESYTGGAHPSHLIWTKNFMVSEKREITFEEIITDEDILINISEYALTYFENKKLEYDLFKEGLDPKKVNYQVFALTNNSIIFYFNEYQIAPYVAGSFEMEIPYENFENNNFDVQVTE